MMKAYCISGVGANERVFEQLELDFEFIPIKWVDTNKRESLQDYARKLSQQIDTSEKFVLIGLSYGGMLVTEMNKFINPERTFLISSVARSKELALWIRLAAKTRLINLIPSFFFTVPPFVIFWVFGVKSEKYKQIILDIIGGIDKKFTKLSIKKILEWDNEEEAPNTIRIHGNKDRLIPVPDNVEYIEVKNGSHFMITNQSADVSRILNEQMKLIG